MKAPGFWSHRPSRPGTVARLLGPAAWIWRLGAWWRNRVRTPRRVAVPVLCVGNLTAGGAGKTPMTCALVVRLHQAGCSAHVVMRGYGGRERGPHRVSPRDSAADVGDEAAMMSAYGPVWVARDRVAGAEAAIAAGADLIILDDGLQNPAITKDAVILMVDAGAGFGNGRIIPAGPLREPLEAGIERADVVVLVGAPETREQCRAAWPVLNSKPVIGARLVPQQMGLSLTGAPVVAFAGIGRPQKFFDTLAEMGARVVAARSFADHAPFTPAILRRLQHEAWAANATLVTTEKDAVRLPSAVRRDVLTVQVRLEPDDWAPIDAMIARLSR